MNAREIINDPAWVPFRYEGAHNALRFAYLPRAAQRAMTFLDPRFIGEARQSPPLPVSSLTEAMAPSSQALHFIFHTAFCGSTLMARALDQPGHCMALKEPAVLVDFSALRVRRVETAQSAAALRVTLDLLSRPLGDGEVQVVKPSNVINPIAGDILDARANSRAVVLHSDMQSYLFATARGGGGTRAFARKLMMEFSATIPLKARFAPNDRMQMTDLQIAALAWLMQAAHLAALAARLGPERIKTISYAVFMERKAEALCETGRHFELNAPEAFWLDCAQGPMFNEHAKKLGEGFDADGEQMRNAPFKDEVESTGVWAAKLAAAIGLNAHLGDTLLA